MVRRTTWDDEGPLASAENIFNPTFKKIAGSLISQEAPRSSKSHNESSDSLRWDEWWRNDTDLNLEKTDTVTNR